MLKPNNNAENSEDKLSPNNSIPLLEILTTLLKFKKELFLILRNPTKYQHIS